MKGPRSFAGFFVLVFSNFQIRKAVFALIFGDLTCNIARNEWGKLSMADAREKELVRKVQALVSKRFAGNYKTAFDNYAAGGLMGEDGLEQLLKDANVGNFATRGTWVRAIMEKIDEDRDGVVSFSELQFLK